MGSPTIQFARNQRRANRAPLGQRIADLVTRFSGSMTFVVIHAVWFVVWIAFNLIAPSPFDPFPFGLLTLIVSLEAIFLSTFVLISQNRQSTRSDERAKQNFHTDIYAESVSEIIAERLGVSDAEIEKRYQHRLSQADSKDEADPLT